MRLYSTANHQNQVSFIEAIQNAFPQDKGLYFPERIPQLPSGFLEDLNHWDFPEMAFQLAKLWIGDEISAMDLRKICYEAFYFPLPLIPIKPGIQVLELFQGPTMAFKDFGARFMAKTLGHILQEKGHKTVILTATSGDTGGAVANGFEGIPNIEVIILFPLGKVSPLQRRQLTTLGDNIHALGIHGNFDDCQRLVKEALLDPEIQASAQFCSANSINIARLIPQSFYYFYGYSRRAHPAQELVFSVPSGNFGNLTAGLLAQAMGLPIHHFLASTNENAIVPNYLKSGNFVPKASLETLATAMDVGNPSNFVRMLEIFSQDLEKMRERINGYQVSDEEIIQTLKSIYKETGYILDPHTAVGVKGLEIYLELEKSKGRNLEGIVLGTAHPAKFPEMVEKELDIKISLPEQLSQLLNRAENYQSLDPEFPRLKDYILKEVVLG